MKKLNKIILGFGALVVLLVLALGAGGWFVFLRDADPLQAGRCS